MEVKIEKLDNLGKGIAYIDAKICFIDNALPNEVVEVDITKENKKYKKAMCKKIIKPSTMRKENICPYHELCGGCSLGHIKYEEALNYKKNKLKEIIYKNTNIKIEPTIIKNDKVYNYRNKITLKIENFKWGYYNSESHNFISIKKCLLAKDAINKIVENKRVFNIKNGEITIRCNNNDEILISIKTEEKFNINYEKIKDLNIVGIVVNNKTIYGQNYFYHEINNNKYKISYNSFFQINDCICSKIFDILNEKEIGNNVLDLYCGVGSLGLSISNKINKLYGIEIIENAIIDAKLNAEINKIKNAKYFVGKVENNLTNINDNIDTIIVDPPRKGLCNIDDILKFNSKKIIYISCDPITLGRDLKELTKFYEIEDCYALDMFPNTYHIESMVILNRKNNTNESNNN